MEDRIRELLRDRAEDMPARWDLPARVQARARRRIALTMAATALAIVVVMVATVAGIRQLTATHLPVPVTPGPKLIDTSAIAGTYQAALADDRFLVRKGSMVEMWTMWLGPHGTIDVLAPPAILKGDSFQITGNEFRTDLFATSDCAGLHPGLYRWIYSGDFLTFTPIHEPCTARAAVLAARPWRSVQS